MTMKKTYIFFLKIEALIDDELSACPAASRKHFKRLLAEMLKHNDCFCELYRSLLLEDFLDGGAHLYDIDAKLGEITLKDELQIIEPFFKKLPEDSQKYFRELIEHDEKKWDLLFDIFLKEIRKLMLTCVSFFEHIDYSKKKQER